MVKKLLYHCSLKKLSTILTVFFLLPLSVKSQNLIVDYHFEGNLIDSSSNSNNLVQYGNGSDVTFSQGITSASLDSSAFFQEQNGLESTSAIDNSNWTRTAISCWIKSCVDGSIFQGAFLGQGVYVTTNGTLGVYFDGSSANSLFSTSSTNLNDGSWHHIVAQNNGTTTQLYIDGTLDGSQAENLYTLSSARSDAKIYLGISLALTAQLDGYIDNLRMYDDTLSQNQIDDLYDAKFASINEKSVIQKITTYPNPANSTITISDLPKDAQLFSITDITGKIVTQNIITGNVFDITSLTSGLYMINILSEDNVAIARGKLIKK
jgi:hypothetical protein